VHCQQIAVSHYENFTVASWLLPRALRQHVYAVYAFCRHVDDLGDEAPGDRLELLAETGTMGIDTLDPPPLGNVELAEAKRRIGGRLFIKGNLNSVALLAYQTKAEVIAEAAHCLRVGRPGGGYILSTACSVAPRVEPWKLELLVPLAEEVGRY
jgi:uroporphyrinogen-III decarboxylase